MSVTMTNKNALVIDDEAFMSKLISLQFHTIGLRSVFCLESGEAALDAIREDPEKFDLIVCDLQMPVVDGIEFIRRLACLAYKGGLILVSGEHPRTLTMAEKLARAHGLNLLGGLSKPFQLAQLKALLDRFGHDRPALPGTMRTSDQVSPVELAQAIADGHLLNHYQPKVCTRTGRVVGFEALVRWNHPVRGLIYPDSFIGVAEAHKLINAVTEAVITGPQGVLQHLKQWTEAGVGVHVAVNISMDNLQDLTFPDRLASLVAASGVDMEHIVLEITESRLHTDLLALTDILTRLRLKRLRLSIDDFGTGYSSLAQLHELPFDELKVDRRFVRNAHQSRSINGILNASIQMAHCMDMIITGEGVETVEDFQHLQILGCDQAQGYWIAKPMAANLVLPWVSAWQDRVAHQPALFGKSRLPATF